MPFSISPEDATRLCFDLCSLVFGPALGLRVVYGISTELNVRTNQKIEHAAKWFHTVAQNFVVALPMLEACVPWTVHFADLLFWA